MTRGMSAKTFDNVWDAKAFLHGFIEKSSKQGKIVIGFVKQSLEKYVIYYSRLESPRFVDDIVDIVNQWQYEHDSYIECILVPFFDNIITIEISY